VLDGPGVDSRQGVFVVISEKVFQGESLCLFVCVSVCACVCVFVNSTALDACGYFF